MNLYELNELIADLELGKTLKRDEELINFYKKKRVELIKTIEQKIKIELNN